MSLIPLMKLRFASPGHLVDINRIQGWTAIEENDGSLRIGALARHNDLAANDIINARYPAMAAAAPQIADPIVRNLGTIGGSLAHADPAGDWGSVMLALGARSCCKSSSGERGCRSDDSWSEHVPEPDGPERDPHRDPGARRPARARAARTSSWSARWATSPRWRWPSSCRWTTATSGRRASR